MALLCRELRERGNSTWFYRQGVGREEGRCAQLLLVGSVLSSEALVGSL